MLIHNTKAILDNFGRDGWELVSVTSGISPEQLVAWFKRPVQTGVTTPTARLRELGITLPSVATPAGAYIPARRAGGLVFTAGQVPFVDGALAATGKVGAEITPEQAKDLARICTLNALAAVDGLVGLDAVASVVKVVGFVASAPGFTGSPA